MKTSPPSTTDRTRAPHPAPGESRGRSWGRVLGITALYAGLGPLAGALAVNGLFTVLAVGGAVARGEFGDIGRLLVGGIVIGTMISAIAAYALGTVPAAGVGLAVALRARRGGGIAPRTALLAALAFWALTSLGAITVVPPEGRMQWIGALLLAHLLAAAACTWIARRVFR